MSFIWFLPLCTQGCLILFDEIYYHKKRTLPFWESIGHPVDTGLFLACIAMPLFAQLNSHSFWIYIGLSCLSSLVITKDEWIHTKHCNAEEHWLHACLFLVHPVVLIESLFLWNIRVSSPQTHLFLTQVGMPPPNLKSAEILLSFQFVGTLFFLFFQLKNCFKSRERGNS